MMNLGKFMGRAFVVWIVSVSAWAQPLPPIPNDDEMREITVKKGETLRLLGGREYWRALYELNKDRIKDPNLIYPGQRLRVTPGKESTVPVFSVLPPEDGDEDVVEVLFAARDDVSFTSKNGTVTPARAGTRLNRNGTITVSVGPARFRFANGTEISVFENSAVYLRGIRRDAATGSVTRSARVDKGRVRVMQASGSTQDKRFVIETGLVVVESREGKMFEVQSRDDGSRVASYEGATVAQVGNSPTTLAQGKGAWIKNDKSVAVYDLPPSAVGAGPEGVSGANVNFVWQPAPDAVKYILRVARDPEMQRTVFAGEIPDTQFKLVLKNDGEYYWTTEPVSGAGLVGMPGAVQRITVNSGSVDSPAAAK